MKSYLALAGTQKSEITQQDCQNFLALVQADKRVCVVRQVDATDTFYIEAPEIESGVYSLGKLCNHLNELPSERNSRLAAEQLPDIINITSFMNYGQRDDGAIRSLPSFTLQCLKNEIDETEPSHTKAQLINILHYKLHGNESIADRFLRDNTDFSHARRHAQLLVGAGCANELNRRKAIHGKIVFEDGSSM